MGAPWLLVSSQCRAPIAGNVANKFGLGGKRLGTGLFSLPFAMRQVLNSLGLIHRELAVGRVGLRVSASFEIYRIGNHYQYPGRWLGGSSTVL